MIPKAASCLLVLLVAGTAAEANRNVPAQPAPAPAGTLPLAIRRPIRVAPDAIGLSTTDLVDRVRHSKSLHEINILVDKLGAVGGDDAIDALLPMLADPRDGVPEAILGAFARIDTELAIDQLIARLHDERASMRNAAIAALGSTLSARAETTLLELSKQTGDARTTAATIAALGELGTDRAVARLVELATGKDEDVGGSATAALGAIDSPAATGALRKLVDSSDAKISLAALSQIDTIDDALLTKLLAIVHAGGDAELVQVAMMELGKSGERALPVLREAALHDERNGSVAISAISSIGGPRALAILGELLDATDRHVARDAAQFLVAIETPAARKLLLDAAAAETGDHTDVLSVIVDLPGADVDAILRKVAKHGSDAQRRTALPRLLKAGDRDALALATELATKGARDERFENIRLLLDTPKGYNVVLDIARKERGQARMMVLDLLVAHQPTSPAVVQLLTNSLTSGSEQEASYAASELGRIESPEAEQALITTLGDSNVDIAAMAATALAQGKMSDHTKAALVAAAHANSRIMLSVMFLLVQSGEHEGMQLAAEAIDGSDDDAASQAVFALSQKDTPESKQLVERALASTRWPVKQSAIQSLGQRQDNAWAMDTLARLARDEDSATVGAALQTLAMVGSERAEQVILEAGRSPKADTRLAAVNPLVMLDDAHSLAVLARLVRDSDSRVAEAAIRTVQSGGPEIESALADLVDDARADAGLRTSAAHQLRQLRAKLGRVTDANVAKLLKGGDDVN
jgi:HEAT repeat protein